MPLIHLSDTLFQMFDIVQLAAQIGALSPSAEVAFFIAEGHIMEVIDLDLPGRKIVALFFGPGEFIIKCHPLSKFVALDDIEGHPLTHGQIIRLLREFPESHRHYQVVRRTYHEKVAARQASLISMSEKARFEDMVKTQPWILKLADKRDIAAYLHISPSLLYELINNVS